VFRFVLRRLLNVAPTLLGISLVAFVVADWLPGDPIALKMGQRGDEATRERLRKEHGLDASAAGRYWRFLVKLGHGDLGQSIQYEQPVLRILAERFVPTLQLAAGAIVFAVIGGVGAGLMSARRPGSWVDVGWTGVALAGVSMPVFWLGMMLIVFVAAKVPWLPTSGYEPWSVRHFLLPWVTLGTVPLALIARLTRASVMEAMDRDWARVARAKGLGEWATLWRYGLRPALIPVVTVVGGSFASLLSGAALTETVFDIPGLGREVFSAIEGRDYPVVLGAVMWFALTFVLVNLAVDVSYVFIDPRVRLEGRS